MAEELRGAGYLRGKLTQKRTRVLRRYRFYEMKNAVRDLGISSPPELRGMMSCLGWCGKAVDSMADRLVFRGFKDDNFALDEIFRMNNPDTLFDSAILSALVSSCCFLYISPDADGYPRLQVIDGGNATGIIDPITGLLREGYAVLERDDQKNPVLEAYFQPGLTTYYRAGKIEDETAAEVSYPLLVPVIYRPDAARPFGHSRISRACMSLVSSAVRTVKRSEVSAEFYSFPQKWVTGLSNDAELIDTWRSAMSAMLTFTRDEQNNFPTVGQFSQQSMSPHLDQLKMLAALFAGETGLTMDDMGFATENPSSSEAIKAGHENLRMACRKAQRCFGTGFLNAGYLAACLRDKFPYLRRQLYLTTPTWEPIFEPDAATLSSVGDGAIKLNQAVPGYFTAETLRDLTGIVGG